MKYIWIIMLAIAYLIWGIASLKDFLYCRKTFNHPLLDHLEDYTQYFIYVNIGGLFLASLYIWLKSKLG